MRKTASTTPPVRGGIIRCLALLLAVAAGTAVAQTPTSAAATTYAYDESGNKTRQTDALGRSTHWSYDALDRVTGRELPDATRETNGYDAVGNLVAKTTFAGERLSFQYDVMDRLASQVIPAGTGSNQPIAAGSAIFRYTAMGMLSSRSEQGPTTLAGEQTFRYDAMDRVVEVKGPTGQINYGRDAAGNVIERSVAGAGTAQYEYDDAGRMTRVTAPDGKQTRYLYNGAGRLQRAERDLRERDGQPQVLLTSFGYDAADRIVLIMHLRKQGAALSLVAGQRLTRAAGGTITRIETDRGDGTSSTTGEVTGRLDAEQDFEYDALGRLTRENRGATAAGRADTRYEYDAVGNRTRKTVTTAAGTEITTYTYDVADRLTSEVTTPPAGGSRSITYTWDANGNLASKTAPGSVTLYRFDPLNRLIDIRQGASSAQAEAAAPHVRYAYDAEGNRVRKWSGGEGRTYLIDHEEMFAQVVREESATESIDYLRGVGLIRQTRKVGAVTEELFPLPGHLGTSLGAVGPDGEIAEAISGDSFGKLDSPSEKRQKHLYAGEYWDQDSGMLYLRARWYEPSVGRFASADPYQGRSQEPRTLNRYLYAHADVVNLIDPLGLVATTSEAMGGLNISAMVRLQNLGQRVNSAIGQLRSACQSTEHVFSAMHRHHAKPKFIGGKRVWDDEYIMRMEQIVHDRLHVLLDVVLKANGFAGRSDKKFGMTATQYYQKLYRRLPGAEPAVFAVLTDIAEVFDAVCEGVPGVRGSLKAKVAALK
jgi:RHS repeat-associated protein